MKTRRCLISVILVLFMPCVVVESCTTGQYGSGTVCTNCVWGTFSTTNTATVCSNCPIGSSQQNAGQSGCIQCATGKYQSIAGQQICISCSPGTYNTGSGQVAASACVGCPTGKYSALAARSECLLCTAGKYSSVAGRMVCAGCDAGKVQTGSASSGCVDCLKGMYASATGLLTCQSCVAGTYASMLGTGICPGCPAGSVNSVTGAEACNLCTPGKYVEMTGQTVCVPCPIKTYNAGSGRGSLSGCEACPLNTYQDTTGQIACKPCAAGMYASPGFSVCETCSLGRFLAPLGCQACPAGQYQSVQGLTQCNQCGVGKYANLGGASVCLTCAAGEAYQNEAGKTACKACTACEVGQFFRHTKCVPTGNLVCMPCTPCPEGTSTIRACTDTSNAVCGSVSSCAGGIAWRGVTTVPSWLEDNIKCPAGEYLWGFDSAQLIGQSLCKSCPEGWVGLNGVYCERCGVMQEPYYVDRSVCVCKLPATMNASGTCVCPDGFKAQGETCVECGVNTWGQGGACLPCADGTTTSGRSGATGCETCPMGQFRLSSHSVCQNCTTMGWYAANANSSSCSACNRSCPGAGWRRTGPCPRDTSGTYSLCAECPEGGGNGRPPGNATWVSAWGNTTLDPTTKLPLEECAYDCVSGFYKDNSGGAACKPCNTSLACGAGWRLTACTAWADSHCEVPCVDESKPMIYSHWEPGNECLWSCDPGKSLSVTDYVMFSLHECV